MTNAVDNNKTSSVTLNANITSAWSCAYITFDLGRVKTVGIAGKIGVNHTGAEWEKAVYGFLAVSTDGITYTRISDDRILYKTGNSEVITFLVPCSVDTRYFRIELTANDAILITAKVYEIWDSLA